MSSHETPNIAIFCDFENVAIGVRDAKHESFDVSVVLARLLDKGKIIVKKAYCDWERYKSSKKPMHEAGFELIEVPHVSYSGKNSADIRLVVDALDLCYQKTHLDAFVIISGDSDFAPLASKLRENDKTVIGLGVKSSTSDLLVDLCDEFIYYDDLVRERKKPSRTSSRRRKKDSSKAEPSSSRAAAAAETEAESPAPAEGATKEDGLDLVTDTIEALLRERDEQLWGSMVKQTIKRKRPSFNETFYGYKSFNQLLEDAEVRGLVELQKDPKSGGYIILGLKQPA